MSESHEKNRPLESFDRLAARAQQEQPPLIRSDIRAINRQLSMVSQRQQQQQDRDQGMPAVLMIFSSAFTGLAACAVVAVMLQITHDVGQSNPSAGASSSAAATQVGVTSNPSQGSASASSWSGPQAGAQARNSSSSTSVDPVADLFGPLQLDLP